MWVYTQNVFFLIVKDSYFAFIFLMHVYKTKYFIMTLPILFCIYIDNTFMQSERFSLILAKLEALFPCFHGTI